MDEGIHDQGIIEITEVDEEIEVELMETEMWKGFRKT